MKKFLILTFGTTLFLAVLIGGCGKKNPVDIILADTALTEEAMERMVAEGSSLDKLVGKLFAHPLAVDKLSEKVMADSTVAGDLINRMAKNPDTLAKMMAAVEAAKTGKPVYMK